MLLSTVNKLAAILSNYDTYVHVGRFPERVPQLRVLVGWYNAPLYKFKVSCNFNDILRCSRTSHFLSCFRDEGEFTGNRSIWDRGAGLYKHQPLLRCLDPTWAIIYTPDKRGDFLGRCFLHWNSDNRYEVGRVYGNGLNYSDIITAIPNLRTAIVDVDDSYL